MYQGKHVSIDSPAPGIAVLRIANPPHGYMDDTTERELVKALDQLESTAGISVVVITGGVPGVFVRHYDTLVLETRARQMAARGLRFDVRRSVPEADIHRVFRQIEASDSTYIAAINGIAMGGGYELALACDLRLASDGDYPIGLPEVNIGLLPGAGGTQRLTRLVGQAKALELMLLGHTLGPREARAYGLVNDVVRGDVVAHALRLAEAIAERPAKARAHIKHLIRRSGLDVELGSDEQALAVERTLFCDLMVGADTAQRLQQMNTGKMTIQGDTVGSSEPDKRAG
ncbi:MAG: enoyl-CoA hydratase/isomerase family protein [Burkholderiaceae bacterium]